jgi:hypothetical protein
LLLPKYVLAWPPADVCVKCHALSAPCSSCPKQSSSADSAECLNASLAGPLAASPAAVGGVIQWVDVALN